MLLRCVSRRVRVGASVRVACAAAEPTNCEVEAANVDRQLARAGDAIPAASLQARWITTSRSVAAEVGSAGAGRDGASRLRKFPGVSGAGQGGFGGKADAADSGLSPEELSRLEKELENAEGLDATQVDIIRRRAMLRHVGGQEDGEFDSSEDSEIENDPLWSHIPGIEGDEGARNVFDIAAAIDGSHNFGQDERAEGPPFRQARPMPGMLKAGERRIAALREGPLAKLVPEFLDYLEHEAWIDRYRDGDSGGAFMDRTIAPWDEFCEEDALYRNVLTDDEYNVPEDYEEPVYIPDRIRSQIYFQWAHKGLSVAELASKYKLRSERIAAFILFKRTEPEYVVKGMVNYDADKLMEGLYGAEAQGKKPMQDWDNGGDDFEAGLDVAVLKDAELPDDCFPVMKFRGNRLRGKFPTHAQPPIPIKERTHSSRYAIRDISSGDSFAEQRRARHIVVDYDGTRRPATKREELARGHRLRRAYPKRVGYGRQNLPFEDIELDAPAS